MKTILEVYDKHCSHLKINDEWIREFDKYFKSILHKNESSVNFFGSILVGVHQVFFDKGDINYLWDILVEVDRDEVKQDLHNLDYINPKWNVGGDVTNHLISYLIRRVLISNLGVKVKESTAINLLFILQYKFLTSLLWRDYKYGVSSEVALTVYNKLSRRFILRQVDSWKELLYLQARAMLYGTDDRKDMRVIFEDKYSDNKLVTDNITGISSNLNSMMKEYNAVFHTVRDESDKIGLNTQLGTNSEGEVTFKDNIKNPIRYQMFLESYVTSIDTFMNDDLLTTLTKENNSRYKPIRKTLVNIAQNYGQRRQDHIKEFTDHVLEFGLNKLRENGKDVRNIREVYDILLGVFSSSRSLDPTLEQLKKLGEKIINDSLGGKTHGNTLTKTRTMVMVYIVIWTLVEIK